MALIGVAGLFTYISIREKEPRAPLFGWMAIGFHLVLAIMIIYWPVSRILIAFMFMSILVIQSILLLRINTYNRPKAAADYLTKNGNEFYKYDERDTPFSRNQLYSGQKEYEEYYNQINPEYKVVDDKRRKRGGPLGKAGRIDGYWWPNISMLFSAHEFSQIVGDKSAVDPEATLQQSILLKNSHTKTQPV